MLAGLLHGRSSGAQAETTESPRIRATFPNAVTGPTAGGRFEHPSRSATCSGGSLNSRICG